MISIFLFFIFADSGQSPDQSIYATFFLLLKNVISIGIGKNIRVQKDCSEIKKYTFYINNINTVIVKYSRPVIFF